MIWLLFGTHGRHSDTRERIAEHSDRVFRVHLSGNGEWRGRLNQQNAQGLVERLIRYSLKAREDSYRLEGNSADPRSRQAWVDAWQFRLCLVVFVIILIGRDGGTRARRERTPNRMILARMAKANAKRMMSRAVGLAVMNRTCLATAAGRAGQQQAEQKSQENEFGISPHIQATELPWFWSVDSIRGWRCQPRFCQRPTFEQGRFRPPRRSLR